jgi:DNA-binding MarR family transcriptional regulator
MGAPVVGPSDASEVVNDLRRLFKAIQVYSKAILKTSGLSGPQLWALSVLNHASGLSLNELSERLFAHPSTVSGIVDRLVGKRWVRRERDPDDGRGVRLFLTLAGRRIVRRSPPPVQAGLARALDAMPPRQLQKLRQSLDLLVRQASARDLEAPFFEVDADPPRRRPARK